MPWSGALFRDLTGQQKDVFTLQGAVGPFVDHYVLDRERGDGTGTRIIRHYSLVEPVGENADEVRSNIESYHSAMDIINEAISRSGDDIVDNDLLHQLAYASRTFVHLDRHTEASTALSFIGNIYDRIGNPAHAIQFRQAALEASERAGEKSGLRTLKRKLQLAGSQLEAGSTTLASNSLWSIIDQLKGGAFKDDSEYWDVMMGAAVQLYRSLTDLGRMSEARALSNEIISYASSHLGGNHEMVRMARELMS